MHGVFFLFVYRRRCIYVFLYYITTYHIDYIIKHNLYCVFQYIHLYMQTVAVSLMSVHIYIWMYPRYMIMGIRIGAYQYKKYYFLILLYYMLSILFMYRL